jgi:hypothetical protein
MTTLNAMTASHAATAEINADFRGQDKNQPFQLATGCFSQGSRLSSPSEVDLF